MDACGIRADTIAFGNQSNGMDSGIQERVLRIFKGGITQVVAEKPFDMIGVACA